jgi:hypothetical protein
MGMTNLDALGREAMAKQAARRAVIFLDAAIENMIALLGVARTVEHIKAHVDHLAEFEGTQNG